MGWVKDGVRVTVDWHVKADGRWMVEARPVDAAPPVNVWVSETRMAPVEYRYQAGECMGWCRLECGHTLKDGCDCDTIAVEAAGQTDEPAHTCGPGIQWGCAVPDCDGDNGD